MDTDIFVIVVIMAKMAQAVFGIHPNYDMGSSSPAIDDGVEVVYGFLKFFFRVSWMKMRAIWNGSL